jgi:hypothetical protein
MTGKRKIPPMVFDAVYWTVSSLVHAHFNKRQNVSDKSKTLI